MASSKSSLNSTRRRTTSSKPSSLPDAIPPKTFFRQTIWLAMRKVAHRSCSGVNYLLPTPQPRSSLERGVVFFFATISSFQTSEIASFRTSEISNAIGNPKIVLEIFSETTLLHLIRKNIHPSRRIFSFIFIRNEKNI